MWDYINQKLRDRVTVCCWLVRRIVVILLIFFLFVLAAWRAGGRAISAEKPINQPGKYSESILSFS